MSSTAGRTRLLVVLLVLVHVALAWSGRQPGIMTGQDDAQYLILGQSIRAGGYHELFRVDRPVHALYPPAYPAVLAVWGAAVGDRYDGLAALSVALSAGSLLLLWLTLRRVTAPAIAVAATGLVAVNLDVVRHAGAIGSEPLYVLLSVLALFLVTTPTPSRRRLLLAGLAAILAALTRPIGVTLLGALAVAWMLERRWKAAGWLSLASLLTVGAWLVWTAVAPDQHPGVSYSADLQAGLTAKPWVRPLPGRLVLNLVDYGRRLLWTAAAPSVPGTVLDNVAGAVLIGVAGAAGLGAVLRRWRPAGLYLLLYGALLTVWTWAIPRYLMPVFFIILPALIIGAATVAGRLRAWLAVPAAMVVAVGLGGVATARSLEVVRHNAGCDRSGPEPPDACLTPDQQSFFRAARHVRDHTPTGAVLLSAKYITLYYYTGRKAVSYRGALARDTAAFLPFLRRQGATHVLLGALELSEANRLAPVLDAVCGGLVLEASFPPRTYLFRIEEAGADAAEASCRAVERYRQLTPLEDFGQPQ